MTVKIISKLVKIFSLIVFTKCLKVKNTPDSRRNYLGANLGSLNYP